MLIIINFLIDKIFLHLFYASSSWFGWLIETKQSKCVSKPLSCQHCKQNLSCAPDSQSPSSQTQNSQWSQTSLTTYSAHRDQESSFEEPLQNDQQHRSVTWGVIRDPVSITHIGRLHLGRGFYRHVCFLNVGFVTLQVQRGRQTDQEVIPTERSLLWTVSKRVGALVPRHARPRGEASGWSGGRRSEGETQESTFLVVSMVKKELMRQGKQV